MDEFQIFTIGHSNQSIEQFLRLVKRAGVTAIADVRSSPVSHYAPQFNTDALAKSFSGNGIAYFYLGNELGGRLRAFSTPENFCKGLDRLILESARHCIAIMCVERDPLDCHRCLRLARVLKERGVSVGHIMVSGEITSHRDPEDRLLQAEGLAAEDFFSREQRLADVYNARTGHRSLARAAVE